MKKWNKKWFIVTSIVVFLPMIAGFLLWNRLPEQLITHWNTSGEPDGSMGKLAAVTVTPLLLFVMHLFCLFMAHLDQRNNGQSEKAMLLVYWCMPAISLFAGLMILGGALGLQMKPLNWMNLFFSLIFILIGNYLPKCRQNGVIGIRTAKTLDDEEIWNKTHRFTGRVWMLGGIVLFALSFLPEGLQLPLFLLMLLPLVGVPLIYSSQLPNKKQRP